MTLRKLILVSAVTLFGVLVVLPAGLTLSTKHVVTVQNEAPGELTNLTIHTRWFDYFLGDLGSGEQVQESLSYVPEGAIWYSFELNGSEQRGLLNGYVTSGLHTHDKVVVTDKGVVAEELPIR